MDTKRKRSDLNESSVENKSRTSHHRYYCYSIKIGPFLRWVKEGCVATYFLRSLPWITIKVFDYKLWRNLQRGMESKHVYASASSHLKRKSGAMCLRHKIAVAEMEYFNSDVTPSWLLFSLEQHFRACTSRI